jgi:hypothetical protein
VVVKCRNGLYNTPMKTNKKQPKTPEYTRRAVARYNAKHDRVNILLPLGMRDRVRALGDESLSHLVTRLLTRYLEEAESKTIDNKGIGDSKDQET